MISSLPQPSRACPRTRVDAPSDTHLHGHGPVQRNQRDSGHRTGGDTGLPIADRHPPSPQPPATGLSPTGGLAATGSRTLPVALTAASLAALGGAALITTRRRRRAAQDGDGNGDGNTPWGP